MTNAELEAAYNALSKRLDQIEKLLKTAVSHKQMTELMLVLQADDNNVSAELTQLKNRVTTLETTVAGIV